MIIDKLEVVEKIPLETTSPEHVPEHHTEPFAFRARPRFCFCSRYWHWKLQRWKERMRSLVMLHVLLLSLGMSLCLQQGYHLNDCGIRQSLPVRWLIG